jgi:hypothetical protein
LILAGLIYAGIRGRASSGREPHLLNFHAMVGFTSFADLWRDHVRRAGLTQGNFALQQMAYCRAILRGSPETRNLAVSQ